MAQDPSIYRSEYPIIYVYSIDDDRHRNALKIGKASIKLSAKEVLTINPCGPEVEEAARDCIRKQTSRSATKADYVYSELAFFVDEDGDGHHFMDTFVHMVLRQNDFKRKEFLDMDGEPQEWYICELEDVKDAIRTIKAGRQVMKKKSEHAPIVFREEQDRAIKETIEQFKLGDQMLWNAKMRFGKTLCSLELIRRQGYRKTLIVTHRPAVRAGWFEDYDLLPFKGYSKGSKLAETTSQKNPGETFATLQREYRKKGTKYIYFASMQDLRGGSDAREGGIDKNHEIFADDWDLIIVDEAHEGTQTSLGKNVLELLMKKHPKMLYLSGTPYNILHKFSEKEIFTWDYNMEQSAKERWYIEHPGEPNDYAELPRMNIRTFRLRDNFEQYYRFDEDYFNFAELFRTWTGDEKRDGAELPSPAHNGRFVHEDDVRAFLNLMHKEGSLYPFSTEEYCELFAHTIWVVPGVKEAKALSALLQEKGSWWQDSAHRFEIVNVAGDGDDPAYDRDETKQQVEKREKKEHDALERVKKAIKGHPRTITISCGRLTTGVTVKPWTGVFMLKGNGDTKAAFYMQTIFRAQSPCKEPFKTDCYAFDFAPDRTITVIDEYLSSQPHNKDRKKRPKETVIKEFLNFCSVVSIDGSSTTEFDEKEFINQVNRAYKECIIRQGFKGRQLYVDLYQISDADRALLDTIDEVIKKGSTKGGDGKVKVNEGGVNTKDGKKKQKQVQNKKTTNANSERKKLRDRYQLILDTLSVRLPMMVFGQVESLEHFDMENFVNSIEDESWEVFMPKGITRDLFKSLLHLYNTDAILASFDDILTCTHNADALPIAERAQKIAELLATFRFPDKETVLTPWNVVNMHMTDTIGGYDFFDERHDKQIIEPRFVSQGEITNDIFADPNTHILEINAKSGVYPLWLAYTLFRFREEDFKHNHGTPPNADEQERIWKTILKENIFVLCMSPMAVKITDRALKGYKDYPTNCIYQPGLLKIFKKENKQQAFVKQLKDHSYWDKDMEANKFDFKAVVGNPPYQIMDGGSGRGNSSVPVYHHFVKAAKAVKSRYVSLIMPARWYAGGRGLDEFRDEMLQDKSIVKLYDFIDARDCFPTVDIAGGVCYFLRDEKHEGLCDVVSIIRDKSSSMTRDLSEYDIFIRDNVGISIIKKVQNISEHFFNEEVFLSSPFGLRSFARGETRPFENAVTLISSDGVSYVHRDDIQKNQEFIDKYKVTIGKIVPNNGEVGADPKKGYKAITKSRVLLPNEINTESYLLLSTFDTEEEANNCAKYFQLKFPRFLLRLSFSSMNIAKDNFQFVPVQDFKVAWTDKMLYDKYGLTEEEQNYVESTIKPME